MKRKREQGERGGVERCYDLMYFLFHRFFLSFFFFKNYDKRMCRCKDKIDCTDSFVDIHRFVYVYIVNNYR